MSHPHAGLLNTKADTWEDDTYVTPAEAAKALGRGSAISIYSWAKAGKVQHFSGTKGMMVRWGDVHAYDEARRSGPDLPEDLLSSQEAAALLGVNPSTVSKLIRDGRLSGIKVTVGTTGPSVYAIPRADAEQVKALYDDFTAKVASGEYVPFRDAMVRAQKETRISGSEFGRLVKDGALHLITGRGETAVARADLERLIGERCQQRELAAAVQKLETPASTPTAAAVREALGKVNGTTPNGTHGTAASRREAQILTDVNDIILNHVETATKAAIARIEAAAMDAVARVEERSRETIVSLVEAIAAGLGVSRREVLDIIADGAVKRRGTEVTE